MREDALLHADEEHRSELEALGVVQGHERDEAALLARACPGRRRARCPGGSLRERRLRGPARYSRATPTSSCRFSVRPRASIVRSASSASIVAGALEHALEQLGTGSSCAAANRDSISARKRARLWRRRLRPRRPQDRPARPRACGPSPPRGRRDAGATCRRSRAGAGSRCAAASRRRCGLTRTLR